MGNIGFHHLHKRKRIYQKHEPYPHPDKLKRYYDKFMFFIAFLCPLINLPQLFDIWLEKNASGVSFASWTGFSIISVVWLFYGILHRSKPIIVMNFFLVIIQSLIAFGTFLYS